LGDRDAWLEGAVGYAGQEALFDLVGPVLEDASAVHGGDEEEAGREAVGADFLETDREGEEAGAVAAVLLGHEAAEEPDICEPLPQLFGKALFAQCQLAKLSTPGFQPLAHSPHGGECEVVLVA